MSRVYTERPRTELSLKHFPSICGSAYGISSTALHSSTVTATSSSFKPRLFGRSLCSICTADGSHNQSRLRT